MLQSGPKPRVHIQSIEDGVEIPVATNGNILKVILQTNDGTPAEFEAGRQVVVSTPYPSLLPQKRLPFSQSVTDDGTPSGSNDLGVDGSVTPVDFWIPADEDNDRYITKLSFICGYNSSAEMYEFADTGSKLTNGIRIHYTDTDGNEHTMMHPRANYSFQRISFKPFSAAAWEERGFAASGDYGWISAVPLSDLMPPFGIKLGRGTIQKLTITIRDDCTATVLFNCRALGFDRVP